MPDYKSDRDWSDCLIPHLKLIVADLLIAPAPDAEDMLRNTDLIVIRASERRIACRVRRPEIDFEKYQFEFTIRSFRPSEVETELSKILRGYGDYLIYAFSVEKDASLSLFAWRIIDLSEFRLWFHRETVRLKGRIPGVEIPNPDGTRFRAFDVRTMPDTIVVKEFGHSG